MEDDDNEINNNDNIMHISTENHSPVSKKENEYLPEALYGKNMEKIIIDNKVIVRYLIDDCISPNSCIGTISLIRHLKHHHKINQATMEHS